MRIVEITAVAESRSAPLYHSTDEDRALQILQNGYIRAGLSSQPEFRGTGPRGVSTTRNRRLWYSDAHAGAATVQFVIDRDRVVQRYRIVPLDEPVVYAAKTGEPNLLGRRSESEEIILTKRLPLTPYVSEVQIRRPVSEDEWEWRKADVEAVVRAAEGRGTTVRFVPHR